MLTMLTNYVSSSLVECFTASWGAIIKERGERRERLILVYKQANRHKIDFASPDFKRGPFILLSYVWFTHAREVCVPCGCRYSGLVSSPSLLLTGQRRIFREKSLSSLVFFYRRGFIIIAGCSMQWIEKPTFGRGKMRRIVEWRERERERNGFFLFFTYL